MNPHQPGGAHRVPPDIVGANCAKELSTAAAKSALLHQRVHQLNNQLNMSYPSPWADPRPPEPAVNSQGWGQPGQVIKDYHPFVRALCSVPELVKVAACGKARPELEVCINGLRVPALIDSGAQGSLIDLETFNSLRPRPELRPCKVLVQDFLNRPAFASGKAILTYANPNGQGPPVEADVTVVAGLGRAILGWDLQREFKLILNAASGTITFEDSPAVIKVASLSTSTFSPGTMTSPGSTTTPTPTPVSTRYSTTDELFERSLLLETCEDRWIGANETRTIMGRIAVPEGLTVTPGATVLAESTLGSDIYTPSALLNARNNNKLLILVRNNSATPMKLLKNTPLPGVTIELVQTEDILEVTEKVLEDLAGAKGDKPPSNHPLTPEKRKYLIDNLNIEGIEPEFRKNYTDLILENHDIFSSHKYDLGEAKGHVQDIKMKTQEPIFTPQFRVPHAHQPILDEWITEMLRSRIIIETKSPYNSPIFVVPKKSGGKRIVLDMRKINLASYDEKFSIQDVRECLNTLGKDKFRIASTIDLTGSFWQVRLSEESQKYVAFTLPHRGQQYTWTRSPMGTKQAPAAFARAVAECLKGCGSGSNRVINYVDDCLAISQNHVQHMELLQDMFNRFRNFNLKLSIKKCFFGHRKVDYLGYQISKDGITIDDSKLDAIKKVKPPNTVKRLQETLGMFNYFRQFIKNYAKVTGPMVFLTTKAANWKGGELTPAALKSFRTVQALLCQRPVINYPSYCKPYNLSVDACQGESQERPGGLGAILSQRDAHGVDRVIAYWSRAIRDSEKRYPIFTLERLALTSALEHFDCFVKHVKVYAYTDHKPVANHALTQPQNSTLSNLQQRLNQYDVEVIYRPGEENAGPDYLSRNAIEVATVSEEALEPIVPVNIIEAHKNCEVVKAFKMFLTEKKFPKELDKYHSDLIRLFASKAYFRDGLLYFTETRRGQQARSRLWAPPNIRTSVIALAHKPTLSGHWATERTVEKVLDTYYWPTIAADVAQFIDKCAICYAKRDLQAKEARQPLQPWPPATYFNMRVHLDLCGPMKSEGPNKYVMALTDAHSKWVELLAIPNKEAETVAEAVFRIWICRYSCPLLLVTDGGKEFNNKILRQLVTQFGCKHHIISSISPHVNGAIERFNRSLRSYLLSYVNDDTMDWEKYLPSLMFAHNTAYSHTTKTTPYEALFTMDPILPWTLTNPNTGQLLQPPTASRDKFLMLLECRKKILENTEETREAYTRYWNQKFKLRKFEPGDQVEVFYKDPPKGSNRKLYRPWRTGYRVVKALGTTVILIKPPDIKEEPFHMNRVRHSNIFEPEANLDTDSKPEDIKKKYNIPDKKPKKLNPLAAPWAPQLRTPANNLGNITAPLDDSINVNYLANAANLDNSLDLNSSNESAFYGFGSQGQGQARAASPASSPTRSSIAAGPRPTQSTPSRPPNSNSNASSASNSEFFTSAAEETIQEAQPPPPSPLKQVCQRLTGIQTRNRGLPRGHWDSQDRYVLHPQGQTGSEPQETKKPSNAEGLTKTSKKNP